MTGRSMACPNGAHCWSDCPHRANCDKPEASAVVAGWPALPTAPSRAWEERAARESGAAAPVVFTEAVRPKYLAGKRGELVAVNGSFATVRLPDEPGYNAVRGRRMSFPHAVLARDAT